MDHLKQILVSSSRSQDFLMINSRPDKKLFVHFLLPTRGWSGVCIDTLWNRSLAESFSVSRCWRVLQRASARGTHGESARCTRVTSGLVPSATRLSCGRLDGWSHHAQPTHTSRWYVEFTWVWSLGKYLRLATLPSPLPHHPNVEPNEHKAIDRKIVDTRCLKIFAQLLKGGRGPCGSAANGTGGGIPWRNRGRAVTVSTYHNRVMIVSPRSGKRRKKSSI